jgi:Ser/Thr protein kinase RdoA (MazF antagonist)
LSGEKSEIDNNFHASRERDSDESDRSSHSRGAPTGASPGASPGAAPAAPTDSTSPSAARRSAQRERYTVQEIGQVLSHYDIGVIREIREYRRGSRRAAKLKLVAERGEFLLKRRASGRTPHGDRSRASASHKLQQIASRGGVPVASLMPLRGGGTLLHLDGRLYELFAWIPGERYNRLQGQARAAGIALARMHGAFSGVELLEELPLGGFSESDSVRAMLATAHARACERSDASLRAAIDGHIDTMVRHLDRIESKLTLKGLPLQRNAICHGDFHPGNTLWYGDSLGAVIDFDSARKESVAAEIANAALQFSVCQRTGDDPRQWPVGLDPDNLRSFIAGYSAAAAIDMREIAPLIPWLMMSSIIAEATSPIARDGDFAGIPPEPFLFVTNALVEWIAQRTRAISAVVEQEAS